MANTNNYRLSDFFWVNLPDNAAAIYSVAQMQNYAVSGEYDTDYYIDEKTLYFPTTSTLINQITSINVFTQNLSSLNSTALSSVSSTYLFNCQDMFYAPGNPYTIGNNSTTIVGFTGQTLSAISEISFSAIKITGNLVFYDTQTTYDLNLSGVSQGIEGSFIIITMPQLVSIRFRPDFFNNCKNLTLLSVPVLTLDTFDSIYFSWWQGHQVGSLTNFRWIIPNNSWSLGMQTYITDLTTRGLELFI